LEPLVWPCRVVGDEGERRVAVALADQGDVE